MFYGSAQFLACCDLPSDITGLAAKKVLDCQPERLRSSDLRVDPVTGRNQSGPRVCLRCPEHPLNLYMLPRRRFIRGACLTMADPYICHKPLRLFLIAVQHPGAHTHRVWQRIGQPDNISTKLEPKSLVARLHD